MGFLSGLTSAISSIGDAFGGVANTVANRVFNREDRKDAQGDRIWEWNLQNQYNSPKEQMKRLSEAGLNPYLYKSSLAGNTAGSIGSSGLGGSNIDLGVGSAFNHLNNNKMRREELQLKKQEQQFQQNRIEKTELDNDILKEKKRELKLKNDYTAHKMGLDSQYLDLSREKLNTMTNHYINQDKMAQRYYDIRNNDSEIEDRFKFAGLEFGYHSKRKNVKKYNYWSE